MAKQLDLTDAFDPALPPRATSSERDGRRVWPFFGLKTPFEADTFDETVIVVDRVMFLERQYLTLLLAEAARISKNVLFGFGPLTEDPRFGFAVKVFREVMDGVRFRSSESIVV